MVSRANSPPGSHTSQPVHNRPAPLHPVELDGASVDRKDRGPWTVSTVPRGSGECPPTLELSARS
eukprot:scaffold649_cov347-Pavlova_lutheri.AAC.132